jgi:hypothetical protein
VKSVFVLVLTVCNAILLQGQTQKPQTLKGTLLESLRTTHNQKDWFVPVSIAVEGVTPEQAKWQDKSGNHSIGQVSRSFVRAANTF